MRFLRKQEGNTAMSKSHIVLLSGGSGSRLWPLSNGVRSKQFLKVLRDDDGNHVSMVQRTYSKVTGLVPKADVTIVTCAPQAAMLAEQIQGDYALAIEPERRNTAPAIMLACAHLLWEQHADSSDPVIVLPIDSFAEDAYYTGLARAAEAVETEAAELVLLGVEPTYPSEKYGYIVPTESDAFPRPVDCFTEKPDAAVAQRLIERGALWNCGVFAFRLAHAMSILSNYGIYSSYSDLRSRYFELPKNSFDYEVVESARSVAVVPYEGVWKDLGTWNTLTEEMADPVSGKTVLDEKTCLGTFVINELDIPVVVAGVPDAVVVATSDGLLVCSKELSTKLKEYVARIDDAE